MCKDTFAKWSKDRRRRKKRSKREQQRNPRPLGEMFNGKSKYFKTQNKENLLLMLFQMNRKK